MVLLLPMMLVYTLKESGTINASGKSIDQVPLPKIKSNGPIHIPNVPCSQRHHYAKPESLDALSSNEKSLSGPTEMNCT